MKFPIVFLTTFLVLLFGMMLTGATSSAQAQSSQYTLSNNQSVSTLMPNSSSKNWNLVYQSNLTTPVVSAIQYQPELHVFVTENLIVPSKTVEAPIELSITAATTSAEVDVMLKVEPPQLAATPSAVTITIDKSEATPATKSSEKVENQIIKNPKIEAATPAVLAASELDSLFDKYAADYGLSSSVLKRIAKCESGLRPEALSSNGAYGGLYQFVSSTWSGNRKAMGLDADPQLRFNAEEAIKTAAFKMSRDGYGAWPVCGKRAVAATI